MKNILIILMIAVTGMVISCGANEEEGFADDIAIDEVSAIHETEIDASISYTHLREGIIVQGSYIVITNENHPKGYAMIKTFGYSPMVDISSAFPSALYKESKSMNWATVMTVEDNPILFDKYVNSINTGDFRVIVSEGTINMFSDKACLSIFRSIEAAVLTKYSPKEVIEKNVYISGRRMIGRESGISIK